ncbi:MAG: hypothetical protein JF887_01440 [Candidatus Dormibacteraeota bacterium]|uniref:Coenzyme Q-binding protein COQ10 START domain-containing protein n=1 Tax=Candidatus Amunia macphersoniae TaxID=3127014 RepID=A0A934KEJ9_9BACT|nr:hypothetical protein [Candidatus Dormibacteraeota bacterium]
MRVGSADVGGEVELVEYQPGADLAWTGVTGIEQRGRWRLRELDPGVTRVTLRIAYQSPGGLTGVLADRLSSGQVRKHVRRTLEGLRKRVEGGRRPARLGPRRPRRFLRPADPRGRRLRGGRAAPAGPSRPAARRRAGPAPLGSVAPRRLCGSRRTPATADRDRRRRRRAQLRRGGTAHHRAGRRAGERRYPRGRARRRALPQPPGHHRGERGVGKAGRRRAVSEHRIRRAADRSGDPQRRGRCGRPRRRVHAAGEAGRSPLIAASLPGLTPAVRRAPRSSA